MSTIYTPAIVLVSPSISPPSRHAPGGLGSNWATDNRLRKLAADAHVQLPAPIVDALETLRSHDTNRPEHPNRSADIRALQARLTAGDTAAAAELTGIPSDEQYKLAANLANTAHSEQRKALYRSLLAEVGRSATEARAVLTEALHEVIAAQGAFHATIVEPLLATRYNAIRDLWELIDRTTHGNIEPANLHPSTRLIASYEHPLDVFDHMLAQSNPTPVISAERDGQPLAGVIVPTPTLAEIANHTQTWAPCLTPTPEVTTRIERIRDELRALTPSI